MFQLALTSLLWAFPFGLIKTYLTDVDSTWVSALRLTISLLIFLPILRLRSLQGRDVVRLFLIGAAQFGLMYMLYIHSFTVLQAHEVALFTITTPIYVTLIYDAFCKRFHFLSLVLAGITVLGTAVIVYSPVRRVDLLTGFALVQASNICFAFGQVAYRQWKQQYVDLYNHHVYAVLYAGGLVACLATLLLLQPELTITFSSQQISVLLYLSVVSSALGFYWWNVGATKVSAGTLAIFNNAKIPLAVACSLLFFGGTAHIPRLVLGGSVIALCLYFHERFIQPTK